MIPQQQIAHYRITAKLGEGGMGEVYCATDTKLGRDVAIKVLPEVFASDADRMARFQREAQVLAALNHPNIAQIYGVEDRALVMELVEGVELKGPLQLEVALDYARQIAEALEYAHERSVVHRDLKPANIKVTAEGGVKLLDFGLAKAIDDPERTPEDAAHSPTLTLGATRVGVILGTAAYMSPEQAAGKPVDKRADIWSFGAVLYELLSGKRAFEGESVSDTLASVLKVEPNWEALPKSTPPAIRKLIQRCLTKNRRQRLQAIGEARILLEDRLNWTELSGKAQSRATLWGWLAAAICLALLGVMSVVHFREKPAESAQVAKVSVLPPKGVTLPGLDIPAISPDGRRIAFSGTLQGKAGLWVRELDSLESRLLPGTEGAILPFWSPDSRSLGFFSNRKLKRTDVGGGSVLTVCDAPAGRGGTWNQNDTIVFAPGIISALYRVAAGGGTPAQLTTVNESEPAHRFPAFLPDGHHYLYTAYGPTRDKDTLFLADLESKERQAVIPVASNAVYVPNGYLLFTRDTTLMAQPFETRTFHTTGDAFPITENVAYSALDIRGAFSASQNGAIAYVSSRVSDTRQLTWFDRSGNVLGTVGPQGAVDHPTISPDGSFLAFDQRDPETGYNNVHRLDLVRGTDTRLTFNGRSNRSPVWSPDTAAIAYYSSLGAGGMLARRAANGAGLEEIMYRPGGAPTDWSHDGKYIIWSTNRGASGGTRIWALPLFGAKKAFPFSAENANEHGGKLSPDSRWLAYVSDESKQTEIYVQSFPSPGGKWQISQGGGDLPAWGRDGKELFYIAADGKMMAVQVNSSTQFEAGVPKPLFEARMPANGYEARIGFDVAKDGRFLIPKQVEEQGVTPITVVLNWPAGLKK